MSMGIAGATIGGFMTALKLLSWRERFKLLKNLSSPENKAPPLHTDARLEPNAQAVE